MDMVKSSSFHYDSPFVGFADDTTLSEKIGLLHDHLMRKYPDITRIAVALYDDSCDMLKTFIHSTKGHTELVRYEAKLSDTQSLKDIVKTGKPRVVNDLTIFHESSKWHNTKLAESDYESSYTLPMYHKKELKGFIFFNATQKDFFLESVLHYLDAVGHLLAITIVHELSGYKTLLAAINTAGDITKHRDLETGSHLARVARYSRLIAKKIAHQYELSDEYIEHMFIFAPLHDIGKIAIPDQILLKTAELTEEEYELMKTHTSKGRSIIDMMLKNFDIKENRFTQMLRNIVEHHHEKLDASGYLSRKSGEEIPLEARIVAVADVFDALTSHRPYKKAWSNQKAFDYLIEMSGVKLDSDCVNALVNSPDGVEYIQQTFRDP